MPGTLLEEAMLQTIVETLYSSKKFEDRVCLITSSKTNFYSKVDKPTILKIEIEDAKYLVLDNSEPKLGQNILAAGFPLCKTLP